jgi:hypothetical protein
MIIIQNQKPINVGVSFLRFTDDYHTKSKAYKRWGLLLDDLYTDYINSKSLISLGFSFG